MVREAAEYTPVQELVLTVTTRASRSRAYEIEDSMTPSSSGSRDREATAYRTLSERPTRATSAADDRPGAVDHLGCDGHGSSCAGRGASVGRLLCAFAKYLITLSRRLARSGASVLLISGNALATSESCTARLPMMLMRSPSWLSSSLRSASSALHCAARHCTSSTRSAGRLMFMPSAERRLVEPLTGQDHVLMTAHL
jgi:hypothetical protein